MYRNKKILALIPARGGSKRVPGKNIRPINGLPLIGYTIKQALQCGMFDRVVVSTDDKAIAQIARQYGAEVPFMRPKALAGDTAVGWQALQHAVKTLQDKDGYKPDFVASLSVCAPLRNKEDIKNCLDTFIARKANLVRSAVRAEGNPYFNLIEVKKGLVSLIKPVKKAITRSQKAPKVYQINDSINVINIDFLFKHKVVAYDKKTHIVAMPRERSVDINEEFDFKIAETLMREAWKK